MSLLSRIFARSPDPKLALRPLYDRIVALARDPAWYHAGVPDTLDGRFEVLTALLAHVLLRLEPDASTRVASAHVTEIFVDDMDAQLRLSGVGDLMVGKHVGKMMAALGGRLGGYRDAADAPQRAAVVHRNLWGEGRDNAPARDASAFVADRLSHFATALAARDTAAIIAGDLPDLRQ